MKGGVEMRHLRKWVQNNKELFIYPNDCEYFFQNNLIQLPFH